MSCRKLLGVLQSMVTELRVLVCDESLLGEVEVITRRPAELLIEFKRINPALTS